MFILNFVGYMVLVTISGSHPDIVHYVDKLVEVVLIILLLVEALRPPLLKA